MYKCINITWDPMKLNMSDGSSVEQFFSDFENKETLPESKESIAWKKMIHQLTLSC